MINNMKKIILTLFLVGGFAFISNAYIDIYDDISNAIQSGNSTVIAGYFNTTVDLTILAQEEVYSKTQAEIILKDFFSKNTPKTFSILHKGTSKEGSMYGIGSLLTNQGGSFRVYFYLKQIGGKSYIQELRFEKQ